MYWAQAESHRAEARALEARISVCALGLGESKIARAVIKLGGSKIAIKQGGSVMKLDGSV